MLRAPGLRLLFLAGLALGGPLRAETWILRDARTGEFSGPFTPSNGAVVALGGRDFSLQVSQTARDRAEARLRSIIIPAMEFRGAAVADVVVAYRAFNERSGHRFGQVSNTAAQQVNTNGIDNAFHYPAGIATPAATVAMAARRYMHDFGATSEDFGRVAVLDRARAATNPKAWFHGKPITLDQHQVSKFVAEPLHLLDCCQESDGGVALVITSAERARDLQRTPAIISAAAQGSGPDQYVRTSYYRDGLTGLPEMGVVAGQLWAQAGMAPSDMDLAVLYDHFTPYVLMQLEELGFCGRGEAPSYLAAGTCELDGALPLNPHGGQLGEAYIHGMNGIAEAVRQLRGTAANQVAGAERAVVTAGTGVPTSGLVLSKV